MEIKPVSPEIVSDKLTKVILVFYKTISEIIYPLAILGYCISVILIITGSCFHSRTVMKMGIVNFCVITLVLISYFFMPSFIGILKSIETILR
ncbi:Zn-dependent membrane protease YugP [Clostridium acetobutylicum]|uniref:Predicted membrane protein n=1 Tax=Clostridium acetobutylicum (strain ATCC 824 / DSM 792 / JCM 1419 / IAM 19013 / LMG 5710 / NBRC 13948 / NRRL B-527 / VKM B-1787 / 2291 / W) TaxID=272562 RepID=Q97HG0_CLOAB|nr:MULTISPECIES: hypothetical protein [Clostridium]AAK80010.1 Predicted membrane protein [Clostridium acetobutylicum ATCC 824]ADZ21102.1 membrane protein [Clostridium acetobutylicum EA 2018]AEI32157.1 hypothetical protein SMB_G2083 [Clostridium acetobutylicum DSM 1731]AWV79561.1 hypothetical protein DK921_05490 [Clostridium acetobutylicum]KHD38200.1 membrane protein [Clostridium acetobutylicum]